MVGTGHCTTTQRPTHTTCQITGTHLQSVSRQIIKDTTQRRKCNMNIEKRAEMVKAMDTIGKGDGYYS